MAFTKQMIVFTAPNSNQKLTIVAAMGRKGNINVKASLKTGGKGDAKAMPGCRGSYATEAEAQSKVAVLVKDAVKAGWTKTSERTGVSARNAFTEIPAPVILKAVPKVGSPAVNGKGAKQATA